MSFELPDRLRDEDAMNVRPQPESSGGCFATSVQAVVLQERAHRAEALALRCVNDCDFESAAYFRGQAFAYRQVEKLLAGADDAAE